MKPLRLLVLAVVSAVAGLLCLAPVLAIAGCRPADVPHTRAEWQRAGVTLLARGVRASDTACAATASTMRALARGDGHRLEEAAHVASVCAEKYTTARRALEGAEAALDAGGGDVTSSVACAAAAALSAVDTAGKYAELPAVVRQARAVAVELAAAFPCAVEEGGSEDAGLAD